jgi:hypothetical protein
MSLRRWCQLTCISRHRQGGWNRNELLICSPRGLCSVVGPSLVTNDVSNADFKSYMQNKELNGPDMNGFSRSTLCTATWLVSMKKLVKSRFRGYHLPSLCLTNSFSLNSSGKCHCHCQNTVASLPRNFHSADAPFLNLSLVLCFEHRLNCTWTTPYILCKVE